MSHTVIFTDRTTYDETGPRLQSQALEFADARRRLAEILRQARRDVSVVVIRDKPAFRVLRQYFLTNTAGPMVFERTITIEGSEPRPIFKHFDRNGFELCSGREGFPRRKTDDRGQVTCKSCLSALAKAVRS